ncbi:MAG: hypothetical protein IJ770_02880 [Alphaproteobacteria bacterium]|nr:hypothetical protein [Alphaproteobacteria bacterium]
MSIFSWLLVICAAMCITMALGVSFDSKCWESSERGGLFVFRHKWVSVLCVPMLFLVPMGVVLYALFVPMNEANMLLQCILRGLIFFGLTCAAVFTFILFASISISLKSAYRKLRKSA